jgi:hypothetical protein
MWRVLKWILALIIGTAVAVSIFLISLLATAIGTLLGFISTGSMIIFAVGFVIYDWWESRKEKSPFN